MQGPPIASRDESLLVVGQHDAGQETDGAEQRNRGHEAED